MRILIYALQRSTAPTGLCRYTANLVHALKQSPLHPEIDLIIGSWQRDYYREIFNVDASLATIIEPPIKNDLVGRYVWPVLNLGKLARRRGADIVHFAAPSAFARSLIGVPVVTTVHDLYAYSHPEVFKLPNRILNRAVLANAITNSDATQVISACTKEEMARLFPDEMTRDHRIIYQPVTVLSPDPGAAPRRPYVLCVAGHRKHKNMPLVIDAMRVLMDRGSLSADTALVIVGERATETTAIEDAATRQGVTLELLSSVSDQTLANLYGGCLAFVVPSEAEGFCLPLVEALMHGRRVVCSDIPIFHEVGRDACAFFSLAGDRTTHLADALQNVLTQPEPPREERRFSSALFAEECAASYASVLEAAKPGP
ncbi:hypothetical protein ASD38_10305 [Caulobacter sp. Root487D2Y]|uniref:glycosyltransferase family 4 protein n=1 Tax=Caulobacter sp. Root487D2Y TaxID=1736547 RepID=UPI0006F87A6C|nr:glycosyltransferase family 1 protein [Caulobacter sp. Root487D2Y]KQY29710.1 hypothetical protein ASD38_10305 [Caulobacter sp. Root487D2Y]